MFVLNILLSVLYCVGCVRCDGVCLWCQMSYPVPQLIAEFDVGFHSRRQVRIQPFGKVQNVVIIRCVRISNIATKIQ